jgi:cyclic beta-1,2-glucan synthetase
VRRAETARAPRTIATIGPAFARALDLCGWDGQWHRRAYYDYGTPIGSASSDECRIDAIAQAWSVMSGVASPERTRYRLGLEADGRPHAVTVTIHDAVEADIEGSAEG